MTDTQSLTLPKLNSLTLRRFKKPRKPSVSEAVWLVLTSYQVVMSVIYWLASSPTNSVVCGLFACLSYRMYLAARGKLPPFQHFWMIWLALMFLSIIT